MKKILCLWMVGILVAGCTYRGQVRRGIYKTAEDSSKIAASILVIADRHIPQTIYITDPKDSDTQAFSLQTGDGVPVAVTDALACVFSHADAGTYTLENQYDFVADVAFEAGLTRQNCQGELSRYSIRKDGLCTWLQVTIRRAGQSEPIVKLEGTRWYEFQKPGFASSVRWVNKKTYIFSPLLTPIYVQAQGRTLRLELEKSVKEILDEIVFELKKKKPELLAVPSEGAVPR